jgi:hypothetical protein
MTGTRQDDSGTGRTAAQRETERLRKAAYRARKRAVIPPPNPPGERHNKKTPERMTAILTALVGGNTRRASAGAADIDEYTLARWIKDDEAFRDAVLKAESAAEQKYLKAVESAIGTSWQAAAWWLERRKHLDFGRRDRVDMKIDSDQEMDRIAKVTGRPRSVVEAEVQSIIDAHPL